MSVEITLDGRKETLRPTLGAARTINHYFGGFVEALRQVGAFNLNAYCVIIGAGMDKRPDDVEDAVYATGLELLTSDLSKYITLLTKGGKTAAPAAGNDSGKP